MTKEEKNEMYRKNEEKLKKKRKGNIIASIVVPVVGIVITFLITFLGNNEQNEIAAATVLEGISIGDFLAENENGAAIYTGTIRAVDPVSVKQESGDYIMAHRIVEQEEEIYDKENKKYETKTRTIANDYDNCDEIEIDDVTLPYKVFHSLPQYTDKSSEGARSNHKNTTFSYTPSSIEGTFFLKCKNGEVTSARYYASWDVAGESRKGFGAAKLLLWIAVIVIEAVIIYNIVKTSKAIKNVEQKIK